MLTPDQALAHILAQAVPAGTELVPLAQATGRVLRQTVLADRDFPPYARVTMDGIAINYAQWAAQPDQWLPAATVQLAGQPPLTLAPGTAIQVMTGAVLPHGADTVVRYEGLEPTQKGASPVRVRADEAVALGQCIHLQGSDRPQGAQLLAPGRVLAAPDIAVAATVGLTHLEVSRLPRLAVVSTGDELVEVAQTPLPHQIRRSNGYLLQAALQAWHAPVTLHHLPDQLEPLRTGLAQLLAQHDALLLSGGVSEGLADLVPRALADLGVAKLFHKVAQRPGKPFWFGLGPGPRGPVPVFALPGNPVSTFVGCCQYVLPWLRRVLQAPEPSPQFAVLAQDVKFAPDLTYFLQVHTLVQQNGTLLAQPVAGGGSGDLANLLHVNGLLVLSPLRRSQQNLFAAGEVFPLLSFR
jgi:molybdopterin molybdotransferase